METVDRGQRWRNAFTYGLVTTIMLLSSIFFVSALISQDQKELAARVDRNAAVSVTAADTVICILQLGVPGNPPLTRENIFVCMDENGYVSVASVDPSAPLPPE